jgi:hypothetical protein
MEYWLLPYLAPMFFIPCKSSLYYLRYQLLSALLTTSPGFDRISEGLLHRWGRSAEELVETVPGGLYVKVVPPPDTNKNTSWFQYPGIWTTYILIILSARHCLDRCQSRSLRCKALSLSSVSLCIRL